MRVYWSTTRPGGKPLNPGKVCLITDLEDGTFPIATLGDMDEADIETPAAQMALKVAQQNGNAQLALARRPAAPAQPAAPGTPPPAGPRTTLTADERMRATLDLQDPAKSGQAVLRLVADETGVDPRQQAINSFKALCVEWQNENPEFYPHPGNKQLLGEAAGRKVGYKVGLITKEILTQTFEELEQRGVLSHDPAELQPTPPPALPGESQVQSLERPRGTRFATAARSTSFRAAQTPQTRTVKYTEEEIRRMPDSKVEDLIRSNDPDFAAACEFHFPQQQATA